MQMEPPQHAYTCVTATHIHALLEYPCERGHMPALVRDWWTGEIGLGNAARLPNPTCEVLLPRAAVADYLDLDMVNWASPWAMDATGYIGQDVLDRGHNPFEDFEGELDDDVADETAEKINEQFGLAPPPEPAPVAQEQEQKAARQEMAR